MIGKKLHLLLNELTVKHVKVLLYNCSMSNDKRFTILKNVLLQRNSTEQDINELIANDVNSLWKFTSEKEMQLKIRRVNHFLTTEIENSLIKNYIEENFGTKQLIIAKALESSSNSELPNIYFQNSFTQSKKDNNKLIELESLEGKLNRYLFANSNKELEEKINLNKLFTKTLSKTNNDKQADYFHSMSTIYIENTNLIKDKKEELIYSIHQQLIIEDDIINKISLFTSLSKLHYDEALFNQYFNQAKELLENIPNDSNRAIEIKQNLLFLEVRTLFFKGEIIPNLKSKINLFLDSTPTSSSMYKNILFYKILISILSNEITKEEVNQFDIYYRGNEKIYHDFLKALQIYNSIEFKKAIPILNELIYCNNYFFSIFSRLILIKIQYKLGNTFLVRSYLNSTQKYMNINNSNPLSNNADRYTLNELRNLINQRKTQLNEKPALTALHQYILLN